MATLKHNPARLVYTGGTLSCHAGLDNLRTPDHGSDQEKNSRMMLHYMAQQM